MSSTWAPNTLFAVPDRCGSWARSTFSSSGISERSSCRAVAAVGLVIPDSGCRAGHTLLSVRIVERSCGSALAFCLARIESESRWAALTFSSNIVIVSVITAGLAFLDCSVPELRSSASNTLVSSIQVRFVSRANTLPGVLIKSEAYRADETPSANWIPYSRGVASNTLVISIKMWSSWRAFTLESCLVKDESSWASDTSKSVGVPCLRSVTGNAESGSIDVSKSRWADASFLISIIDFVGWACITRIGPLVPPARRGTWAPSSCVDSGEVGRTDTSLLVSIIDFVGGAWLTEFGLFVEEFWRSTSTFSIRSSNGVRWAADLERSSWWCTSWADTLEESTIKYVSRGAAVEARSLIMAQRECLREGDEA